MNWMETCRRIAENTRFQYFVLGVILVNAVLVGLETSTSLISATGPVFHWLDRAVLAVFVLEIAIRWGAYGREPWKFFHDGWNVFDLTVVVASLLPDVGTFATIARLVRVIRVLRVISVLPELRLIVSTLLRSLPSVGNVGGLLGLLLYVYGIFGYHLFHTLDPKHWGTLSASLLTLFQMLTLEGWVEVQNTVLPSLPWAWVYFASFIVIAVFVVINLFIAIVINSLEGAKAEHQAQADALNPQQALLNRIDELKMGLDDLERTLRKIPIQQHHVPDTLTVLIQEQKEEQRV